MTSLTQTSLERKVFPNSTRNQIKGRFAPVTDEVEAALSKIPPAGQALWRWLRRLGSPGTPLEIDLEEFQEYSEYCWRTVYDSFELLLGVNLVNQIKKISSKFRRIEVLDPGFAERKKNSQNWKKNSQKSPLNPCQTESPLRGLKETNTPERVSFKREDENFQREIINDDRPTLSNSEEFEELIEPTTSRAMSEEVEARIESKISAETRPIEEFVGKFKFMLLAAISKVLKSHGTKEGAKHIREATSAACQGYKKNPKATVLKAIKEGWKPYREGDRPSFEPEPLPAAEPGRSPFPKQDSAPDGFSAWFDLARKLGIAIASEARDDGFVVHFADRNKATPWAEALARYPLEELRGRAELCGI
jgi:hypothetical protein